MTNFFNYVNSSYWLKLKIEEISPSLLLAALNCSHVHICSFTKIIILDFRKAFLGIVIILSNFVTVISDFHELYYFLELMLALNFCNGCIKIVALIFVFLILHEFYLFLQSFEDVRVSRLIKDGKYLQYVHEDCRTLYDVMRRGARISGNFF